MVDLLTARLAPASQPDGVLVIVPFGEAPLAGARIDALREFVGRIAALGQAGHGRGAVTTPAGSAWPAVLPTGYVLADAALPASKCDLVAEADRPGARQHGCPIAVPSSHTLAELRKQHASITIDVIAPTGRCPGRRLSGNGERRAFATAGEWNAVAAANNRVEIRWHPAP